MKATNRQFKIWKIDFTKVRCKTGDFVITEVDYFDIMGISRNGSLVLRDIFLKKRWIKKEYFNSTCSPVWRSSINKTYGYIIREQFADADVTEMLSALSFLAKNDN